METNDPDTARSVSTISSILKECVLAYKLLLSQPVLRTFYQEVPEELWQNQMQRLRVWATDTGAYAQGRSSLEVRLRESPDVQQHIRRTLHQCISCIGSVRDYIERQRDLQGTYDDSDDSDSDGDTLVQELFTNLDVFISSLLKIGVLIRNSPHHQRAMLYDRDVVNDTAPFFESFIGERYPDLEEFMMQRLGRSIARRRAEIEFRKKQNDKRKSGLSRFLEDTSLRDDSSDQTTIFTDYALSKPVEAEDARSTSSAVTIYTDVKTSNIPGGLQIANAPTQSYQDAPFECPYCFKVIEISNLSAWQHHVFQDSLPYICIFKECSTPEALYASRRKYFAHLHNHHAEDLVGWRNNTCNFCGEQPEGDSLLHLSQHMLQVALYSVRPYDSETIVTDKESTTLELPCPFRVLDCQTISTSVVDFKMHVFTHFRGYPLPQYAVCFFCDRHFLPEDVNQDPADYWNKMMNHVIYDHLQQEEEVPPVKLDIALMRYMWNRGIISDADLKKSQLGQPPIINLADENETSGRDRVEDSSRLKSRSSSQGTDKANVQSAFPDSVTTYG